MINKPSRGGWCRFNFGGVDQEIGDYSGKMCVPDALTAAFVNRLKNDEPVIITLDDEGAFTSFIEYDGYEECWFVIRHDDDGRMSLKVIEDVSPDILAQELIDDLQREKSGWEFCWGCDCERNIAVLKDAIGEYKVKEIEWQRLLENPPEPTPEQIRIRERDRANLEKDFESYGKSERAKRLEQRSRSINWDESPWMIGWPGNGWYAFKIEDIDFTCSSCGALSPVGILHYLKRRVQNKRRLALHLGCEGPELFVLETDLCRYAVTIPEKGDPSVRELTNVTLRGMCEQALKDMKRDRYEWQEQSYGSYCKSYEDSINNEIGEFERVIRKRWPRKKPLRTPRDWECFRPK